MPSTGTVDYTAARVMRIASDAIRNFAEHTVAQAREGRLVTTLLRAAPSSARDAYDRDYELPPLSVGDTIDGIDWVEAGGNSWPLTPFPEGLESTFYSRPDARGQPAMYALQDGVVRIFPTPEGAGTVRIHYQRTHGDLVALGTDNATVNSVTDNGGAARVVLSASPASFVVGAWVDVLGVYYPYRTKIHGAIIATAHGGNQFTLSTSYTDFVNWSLLGDTAALYGKTPYVSLPLAMRRPLIEYIASIILGQVGDPSSAAKEARAERGNARVKDLLQPRTKAQPPKAFNPNSLFRSASRRMRRWSED